MPVAFTCPACREPVSVSRRYAGTRNRCPRCAALVDVPAASTRPLPDGVVETDDVPAPPALLAALGPAPELPTRSLVGLGGLGLLLGAGLAVGALQLRRPLAPPPEQPSPPAVTERPAEDLLAPLRAALATLQARVAAAGQTPVVGDLAPLRLELDRLCRTPLAAEEAGALAKVGLRLSDLAASTARSGAEAPAPWILLQREAVRRVSPLAEAPPTGLRARASVRLGHPRRGLIRAVALADGPDALTAALVDARWVGVLGPSGYDELQGLVSRSPGADPDLRPRLADLRARAAAYASALGEATRAEADPGRARRAFESVLGDASDPWPRATLEVLELLAGRAAAVVAPPRTPETAKPAGPAVPAPSTATEVGPTSTDRGPRVPADWRVVFRALAKEHRSAQGARKGEVQAELTQLVTGLHPQAKGDFAAVDAIVSVLDETPQPFLADQALRAAREPLHAAWFDLSLDRATGPMSFLRLDKWCVDFDHDEWRTQLRPHLELLAAAKEPAQVERERARVRRAQAVAAATAFRADRADQLATDLEELTDGLREQGFAPDDFKKELLELVRLGIERAGRREAAARLTASITSLKNATPEDEKARRTWRKALDKVRGATTKRLIEAVDDCLAAGEPGLGFDLLGLLLQLDPSNARAHKGLNHVEVGGRWLRAYDADRWRQGYAWDPRRAWVRRADAARYDKGEVLDIQRGEWTTAIEADIRHTSTDDPWVVETEHFRLRSTAGLARTAAVATRLEAFYLAVFRQYDLFFAQRGGAALVFGVAPIPRPLEVWFYADETQYRTYAKGYVSGSAGFYSSATHASYFYDMGEDYSTLQHELVHQVLGENSPNGDAPAWLAEGAAVLLEDARFEDGVLVVGGVEDNDDIRAWRDGLLKGGRVLSLQQITQLVDQADWNRGLSIENYKAAGATLHFLCHFDGGRYRGDLVDMLKDAYWSRPTSLQNSFGLPPASLEAMMRRFYGVTR